MADASEYTGTLTLTLSELGKVMKVSRVLKEAAEKRESQSVILQKLKDTGLDNATMVSIFSKIVWAKGAGIIGIAWTAFELVQTIVGSISSLAKVLANGHSQLSKHHEWFSINNAGYQRVKFEVAFLEYRFGTSAGVDSIRYITAAGPITSLQLKNGSWISAS